MDRIVNIVGHLIGCAFMLAISLAGFLHQAHYCDSTQTELDSVRPILMLHLKHNHGDTVKVKGLNGISYFVIDSVGPGGKKPPVKYRQTTAPVKDDLKQWNDNPPASVETCADRGHIWQYDYIQPAVGYPPPKIIDYPDSTVKVHYFPLTYYRCERCHVQKQKTPKSWREVLWRRGN